MSGENPVQLKATLPDVAGYAVRQLQLADLEAVHTLELALFPADAWPLDMFLAEVVHETRGYIVAEADGKVIAYAGVMSVGDTADVQTIAVAPEHEGHGLGRAMLTWMCDEAKARGAEQILLEVRADNPRAQDLYTRNGFKHIHTRPRYYNDGVDALIMLKELKG